MSISKFSSHNLFLDDDKIFAGDENILSLTTDVMLVLLNGGEMPK